MKACRKCGALKATEDFYRRSGGRGRDTICKTCVRRRVRERERRLRAEDPEWMERERARCREKALRDYHERLKHDPAYWKRHTENTRRYRKRNPRKYAAHIAVSNALRDGDLVRPETCDECGGAGAIEAHHDDYSRPLDVRWLCVACHNREHMEAA